MGTEVAVARTLSARSPRVINRHQLTLERCPSFTSNADICSGNRDVRFVPLPEVGRAVSTACDLSREEVSTSMRQLNLPSTSTRRYDRSLSSNICHACANFPTGENASNWLPAPDGLFSLFLRLYQPSEAVRNGTWALPQVVKIK